MRQIYQKNSRNTRGKPIRDLTHWFDYLENQTEPLQELIERQMQRAQQGGPGAKYAQRDLQAITKAFSAHIEFRNAVVQYLNDLGDAYLAEKAKARAYEKRSEKLWNLAFSGAMTLANHMGRELDTKLAEQKNRVA